MYCLNLKSVAFPVPEIIGGTQKIVQSLDMPTLPFLQNFSCAFIRMDPVIVLAKFEVRSFTHSWHNSDWSFGWGDHANPRSWGRGGHRGSGIVPFETAKVSSYRLPIVTFSVSLCVSEILPHFCASECHFSHPTSTLPQISPCSPGSRWMSFGLRRAKVLGKLFVQLVSKISNVCDPDPGR